MKFLTSLIAGLAYGSKLYLDWSLDFEDAINIGGPVPRENGSIDFMLIERDQKDKRLQSVARIANLDVVTRKIESNTLQHVFTFPTKLQYTGNQIAVLDTDNLIEIFNKDFEHVESVRTSVYGYAFDLFQTSDNSFLVSQLASGGLPSKKPSLIQKVWLDESSNKWHHMNVIEDHPETEILQNPVWCLSEDKIIGFDKYLYSWDRSGEFLAKKRLPHQANQCAFYKNKLYMTGNNNKKNFVIYIVDPESLRLEEEIEYVLDEDWDIRDAILWLQPVSDKQVLVAFTGPEGYKILSFKTGYHNDEL